ncbi:21627_t:CDS:2, partial [Gigaspora margarita]
MPEEERAKANNEEQDALYDIDPFPQYPNFQSMLNALLFLNPFELISHEFLDDDIHYNQLILPDTEISTSLQPIPTSIIIYTDQHILQPTHRVDQNVVQWPHQSHNMSQNVAIWQEQETIVQNIPQRRVFANSIHIKSTNLTTDSNTSTNEYYQQILTSPNIQMEKQWHHSQQQMPYQEWQPKMPRQKSQNMLQRLSQTTPSQTNNQFISYGPTQQLAWQQQLNIVMYTQQADV